MDEGKRELTCELASQSDLAGMAAIEQACFPNDERAYTLSVLQEWFSHNPNMFHVVRNSDGGVQAFIIVTPINENLKEKLEAGIVSDLIDFDKEDVLPDFETDCYFVADICVDPTLNGIRKLMMGGKLMGDVFSILKTKEAKWVYSSPISSEGKKALESFGFEIIAYDNNHDECPIYIVTPEKIMDSRAYKMLRR